MVLVISITIPLFAAKGSEQDAALTLPLIFAGRAQDGPKPLEGVHYIGYPLPLRARAYRGEKQILIFFLDCQVSTRC